MKKQFGQGWNKNLRLKFAKLIKNPICVRVNHTEN